MSQNEQDALRLEYERRVEYLKQFGYDIVAEKKSLVAMAQPIEGRILEVGTGKGDLTVELALNQKNGFISLDASDNEQQVALANLAHLGRSEQVELVTCDAMEMHFHDGVFDVVFCCDTLHHIAATDRYSFVAELLRVTAPKGRLIISDFNEAGVKMADRIYESKGSRHLVSNKHLKDVYRYLQEREIPVLLQEREFHQILLIKL